jgi:hypothetical protein
MAISRYDSQILGNDSDMRFTFHNRKTQLFSNSKNVFDNAAKGAFGNTSRISKVGHHETFKFGTQSNAKSRNTALFQKTGSLMKNNVGDLFKLI